MYTVELVTHDFVIAGRWYRSIVEIQPDDLHDAIVQIDIYRGATELPDNADQRRIRELIVRSGITITVLELERR